jgi:hypothetical protein
MNGADRFDDLARTAASGDFTRRQGLKSLLACMAAAIVAQLFSGRPSLATSKACHSHKLCKKVYQDELRNLAKLCRLACAGLGEGSFACFQQCYNSQLQPILDRFEECLSRPDLPCDANSCETCNDGNCISTCSGGEQCVNGQCLCPPPARLCGIVGLEQCCTPQQECTPTVPPICVDRCSACERWDPDLQTCVSDCGSCLVCQDGICREACAACETCDANGKCASTCRVDQVCQGGTCICPAGTVDLAGSCCPQKRANFPAGICCPPNRVACGSVCCGDVDWSCCSSLQSCVPPGYPCPPA